MKRKIELLDTYSPEDFTQILAVLNYCSRSNYKHRTEMQNYFTEIDGITKQTLTRFFRIVRYVPKDGIFKSVQHKTPDGEEIDRRVADYRIKQIADTILERFKKIKTGVTVFDEESMTDFNNLDKNIKYWAENFKFSPKTKSKSKPTSPRIIDSTKPDRLQNPENIERKCSVFTQFSHEDITEAAAMLNFASRNKKTGESGCIELIRHFREKRTDLSINTYKRIGNIIRYIPSHGIEDSLKKYTPNGTSIDRKSSPESIKSVMKELLQNLKSVRTNDILSENTKVALTDFEKNINYWSKNIDLNRSSPNISQLSINSNDFNETKQVQCLLPSSYDMVNPTKDDLIEAVKINILPIFHMFFKYKCNLNLVAQNLTKRVTESCEEEKLSEMVKLCSASILQKYNDSIFQKFSKIDLNIQRILDEIIESITKTNWFFTLNNIVDVCNKSVAEEKNKVSSDDVFQRLLPSLNSTCVLLNSIEGLKKMVENANSFYSKIGETKPRTTYLHQTELILPVTIKKLVNVKFWFAYTAETKNAKYFALIVDESSKLSKENKAWAKTESGLQYKIDFPYQNQEKNEIEMIKKIMDEDNNVHHLVIVDRIESFMETCFLKNTQKKGNLVLRLPKCNPQEKPSGQRNFAQLIQRFTTRHFFNHFKKYFDHLESQAIEGQKIINAIVSGTKDLNRILTKKVLTEMYMDTGLFPMDVDRIFYTDLSKLDKKYKKILGVNGEIPSMHKGTALWKAYIPERPTTTALIERRIKDHESSINPTPEKINKPFNKQINKPFNNRSKIENKDTPKSVKSKNLLIWKPPPKKSKNVSIFNYN